MKIWNYLRIREGFKKVQMWSYLFEIEKSTNGIDWNYIGATPAQGNTNQLTNYEFTDYRDCVACVSYYRIKQIDLNGEYTFLPTLLADCEREGILLYPNPANKKVNISLNLTREDFVQIALLDVTGKTVELAQHKGFEGQNTFVLDIQQIQSGSYLIQVNTSSQSFTENLRITE